MADSVLGSFGTRSGSEKVTFWYSREHNSRKNDSKNQKTWERMVPLLGKKEKNFFCFFRTLLLEK